MMISKWKKPFGLHGFYKKKDFSALRVKMLFTSVAVYVLFIYFSNQDILRENVHVNLLDRRIFWFQLCGYKYIYTLQVGTNLNSVSRRFNPFRPEFTIVIFIHYKPLIAVAIPDL